MVSLSHPAPPLRPKSPSEHPFAFRCGRRVETYADRDEAEDRADQLGAEGISIEWIKYPRVEDPDDFPDLRDDPPRAADLEWLAAHPAMEAAEDYGDFMAWLDFHHDLPWDYYPGPGLWSVECPCLPERKEVAR